MRVIGIGGEFICNGIFLILWKICVLVGKRVIEWVVKFCSLYLIVLVEFMNGFMFGWIEGDLVVDIVGVVGGSVLLNMFIYRLRLMWMRVKGLGINCDVGWMEMESIWCWIEGCVVDGRGGMWFFIEIVGVG